VCLFCFLLFFIFSNMQKKDVTHKIKKKKEKKKKTPPAALLRNFRAQ